MWSTTAVADKAPTERTQFFGVLPLLIVFVALLVAPSVAHADVGLPHQLATSDQDRVGITTASGLRVSPQIAIGRESEPVILLGSGVSELLLWPIQQLLVYVYRDSSWQQIPHQIDEITMDGSYAATEDGILDSNDEIVFMARDLGEQAPADPPIDRVLPVSNNWYAVEVTDPLSHETIGWAYLVRSAVLAYEATADYVQIDSQTRRISTVRYELGFPLRRAWLDFLALGGGPDILDRTKFYLQCLLPLACPVTEWKTARLDDTMIKDGPVRAIARDGKLRAYESLIDWQKPYHLPAVMTGDLRLSTDFNAFAIGASYYNASKPEGVTVDGIPDSVPAQPASSWWQVSTLTGSLVQVTDFASIGELPSNYYVDDRTVDKSDTGDESHYGDTGLRVSGPNMQADYIIKFYILPGKQPNLGAMLATCAAEPLRARTLLRGHRAMDYLPLVVR